MLYRVQRSAKGLDSNTRSIKAQLQAARTHSIVQGAAQEGVVAYAVHHQQQAVAAGHQQAQEGECDVLGLACHQSMRLQVVHAYEGHLMLRCQLQSLLDSHLYANAHAQAEHHDVDCFISVSLLLTLAMSARAVSRNRHIGSTMMINLTRLYL